MKDRHLEEKPACSISAAPTPGEATCSQCGHAEEIWSDEKETKCSKCGSMIRNEGVVPGS
jgi:Zn finger protein HypA/HybF involved in hydrogenase expression